MSSPDHRRSTRCSWARSTGTSGRRWGGATTSDGSVTNTANPSRATIGAIPPPHVNATAWPAAAAARAIGTSGTKCPAPPPNVNRIRTAR